MPQYNQWLRDISLVIGKSGGSGIDLSKQRISFDILKTDTETPNKGVVRVWNLSDDTAQKIRDEFDTLVLNAGYKSKIGLVYSGNITQVRRLREGVVDKILEVTLGDGDKAYVYAMVNKTLAAGAKQLDILTAAVDSMKEYGVELGSIPDLGSVELPRGKVVYKNARDVIADVCKSTDTTWSIQNGRVELIPKTGTLPGQATLISPSTGMIGSPKQTSKGLEVSCLLNTDIRIGGTIKVEGEIEEVQKETQKEAKDSKKQPAKLASDGVYRVIQCRYIGDTWQNTWYCQMVAVAMDSTASKTAD